MGNQQQQDSNSQEDLETGLEDQDLDQSQDQEQNQDQEQGQSKSKTPKTPEEYEEELLQLRRTLRKTRQEAARRRVDGKQLKQAEGATEEELEVIRKEKAALEAKVAQFEAEKRRTKQENQVKAVAAKLRFKHPDDLVRLGDIEFDPEADELDADEIEGFAKKLARLRPELIDLPEAPDLDSQRKGKPSDAVVADEAELAHRYGIRYMPPTNK